MRATPSNRENQKTAARGNKVKREFKKQSCKKKKKTVKMMMQSQRRQAL